MYKTPPGECCTRNLPYQAPAASLSVSPSDRAGDVVVSLGTSGTLFGKSDTPILDPSGIICPFCDATGGWLPLLCTLNCTRVPEEVRQAWGLSQEEATRLAAQEPAGCEGLLLLPYLVGERTPNWPHSSGAILGLRPGELWWGTRVCGQVCG
jgi:xylulokinase